MSRLVDEPRNFRAPVFYDERIIGEVITGEEITFDPTQELLVIRLDSLGSLVKELIKAELAYIQISNLPAQQGN